ncbi:flagellar biosynthesis protein FlgI [Oleiphilus sp. HI0071]|jgi:flagellar P-ring protein precursor FlgI|nr:MULTISPECIES: flagellar basal body P-ring protein FlgI [unclassified Oleiphilus]KZY63139.1 flagellar biosynthesis protein FlgI [Oleiphilus sp. HI0065]KZY79647.1 flagellar biosynthesis protein FlgI [Oleiphilus sp. HI0071]KZZ06144.1 flagellar biosynthesis protein FlgI [Oleiphilus sp. HI0073]KZZ40138.1 flagellar biosynthesis protein FlgI [Oleiphilus sp. HI0118]KZZ51956.1 flagellar biosynthesis protein FlgI [Oleiphilus sp. HI0122]KZZ72694.1 flagellar biosynthesis protein FlgI [Oleiphilus sp. H
MLRRFSFLISAIALVVLSVWLISPAHADRLKDIAGIEGVRSNQLIGYGLVVGLDGTGDKTPFTSQTFRNLMNQFGITIPPGVDPKSKNIAAVAVHADLPAFAKPGQKIDITVSSLGDSKSLRGGSLLMTPLKGADGRIYAISQGSLVVGGFGAEGSDGSSITVNVPSVGRIPNGATVERSIPSPFSQGDSITFNLHNPDFTTAMNVSQQINDMLGPGTAYAQDGASIIVRAPRDSAQRVSYLSMLENLNVQPGEAPARVIINSRTGTIVVGQNVRVLPAAVTHGSLTVTINEEPEVSQPNAFADGETVVVPRSEVSIEQENGRMFEFGPATTLSEIVQAVNRVGAAPGDIMAVLEALKQAGALKADLVVI